MPRLPDLSKMTEQEVLLESVKIAKLRTRWKDLKSKHAAVLRSSNVRFGEDLGPLLDKQALQWKQIQLVLKATKNWADLKRSLALSKPLSLVDQKLLKLKLKPPIKIHLKHQERLQKVAQSYKVKLKDVGDPANKEMTDFLETIITLTRKHMLGNNC